VKSNDRRSDLFSGQTSKQYNSIGGQENALSKRAHFQSCLKILRQSAEVARGYSAAKCQKQKKTLAVKHKTVGNYHSGRPDN